MSRTPRPVDLDRATAALVLLINDRVDKPCPTREDIMLVTGVQRREVWNFVASVRDRGVIEYEQRGDGDGILRRMRVFCGQWTDWTQRKARLDACA